MPLAFQIATLTDVKMASRLASYEAILLVILGMGIIGFIDNFIFLISVEASLWQFMFLRSILAMVLVIGFAMMFGLRLRPNRFWAVAGRSLFTSTGLLIYFGCLGFFPINQVLAGFFSAPIFVVFISALWRWEPVGPIRLVAALIGFTGTLLAIGFGGAELGWPNLIPIVSGFFYAMGGVATRQWCEGEGALSLLSAYIIILGVAGGIMCAWLAIYPVAEPDFLTRGWVWPGMAVWASIGLQAVGSAVAFGSITRAYLVGEAGYVAIFEYIALPFTALFAWMLWGTALGWQGFLGMILIILAGSVVILRTANKSAEADS